MNPRTGPYKDPACTNVSYPPTSQKSPLCFSRGGWPGSDALPTGQVQSPAAPSMRRDNDRDILDRNVFIFALLSGLGWPSGIEPPSPGPQPGALAAELRPTSSTSGADGGDRTRYLQRDRLAFYPDELHPRLELVGRDGVAPPEPQGQEIYSLPRYCLRNNAP